MSEHVKEHSPTPFFTSLNELYGGIPLPVELLEQVLSSLSRTDILRLMYVCKLWYQASAKSLHQEVRCDYIMRRKTGALYLQQFRKHKHYIRHIHWRHGLLPLLRFLELVPDIHIHKGSPLQQDADPGSKSTSSPQDAGPGSGNTPSPQDAGPGSGSTPSPQGAEPGSVSTHSLQTSHLPFVLLNMGRFSNISKPEWDHIDLDRLSPTAVTRQIRTLKLNSLQSFGNHPNTDPGLPSSLQLIIALIHLFPRVQQLKLPTVSLTLPGGLEASWTSKFELHQRQDLAGLRWQLIDLEVDPSLFRLVDERWFFEKSWYLTRLHFTGTGSWTQHGPCDPKKFARLLIKCCPNIEEVALTNSASQYFWHLDANELASPPLDENTASAAEVSWDDVWTPLHNRKHLDPPTVLVSEDQDGEEAQEYIIVHPRLKRAATVNTLTLTDLILLSQPYYSQQLTHLTIDRQRPPHDVNDFCAPFQILLQNLVALKVLAIVGYHFSPALMVPCNETTHRSGTSPLPPEAPLVVPRPDDTNDNLDNDGDYDHDPVHRPWACLGLERLKLSIHCSTVSPVEHRRVFAQLGRLVQLETLELFHSSLLLDPAFGLEAMRGLTRLHTFGYTRMCYTPSKAGVQWMFRRAESEWHSLAKIHLDVGHAFYQSGYMREQFQEWIQQVSSLEMRRKLVLYTTPAPFQMDLSDS